LSLAAAGPRGERRGEAGRSREVHRRGWPKLVERTSSKSTAKGGIDIRRARADDLLRLGQAWTQARVDTGKSLAEMTKRGLWRGRAHGESSNMFMICSIDS
jgi:hypothetical protein